jgi:hypothetical protein
MMFETSFLIVPFDYNADGKLQPGAPARLDTEDAAEFAAQQVAIFHAGIAVIEEPARDFAEPRLVATFGRIPVETLEVFRTETKVRACGRLADRALNFVTRAAGRHPETEFATSFSEAVSRKRRALRAFQRSCEWRPA